MPLNIFKRKSKRACVIGLDGVPFTLIKNLIEMGVMPRTREITFRGRMEPMTVTLPEISSVSWSTFMTGANPGEHGIFGFTDLKENSYSLRFPSFADLKCPTIWDILGEKGMRSIVINQPSTYPARPIPGVLISGFVAIDLAKSVSPPTYLPSLNRAGYQIDVDTQECAGNPGLLFSSLDELLAKRRQVMDDLWEREQWNLMQVVVTGTDRLHHFMWDAYESTEHPHYNDFLDYYRKVDHFIGHAFDKFMRVGESENFFIISDHGFCGTKKEVYVNSILKKEGFLHVAPGASSLEDIDENTKAFALDPARIYLHTKGRFPKGSVAREDIVPLQKDIRAIFDELVIDGEKIVRIVFTGDEAYKGPFSDRGPDLLLVPNNGYDLKGRVGADASTGERRLQGMHTWDNAFFFSLDASLHDSGGLLNIVDVPGKILRNLGIES